jgi:hypothetical protein
MKNKNSSGSTKSFGAKRTMSPQRVKDTSADRGRAEDVGQNSAGGRPPLMKK